MKLTDEQRKAMFAKMHEIIKASNYDGLEKWFNSQKNAYGESVAEEKLYRKLQFREKKISQFGSIDNYVKDRQKKRFDSYFKSQSKKRDERSQARKDKIIEKYGSMENYINQVRLKEDQLIEDLKKIRDNPMLQKANRNYALTGSKYYKTNTEYGMDSIHCSRCTQRLGNSFNSCPVCLNNSIPIYGKMLGNPQDPRWLLPEYNNNAFNNFERPSPYNRYENKPTSAENKLKDRMSNFGDTSDLI